MLTKVETDFSSISEAIGTLVITCSIYSETWQLDKGNERLSSVNTPARILPHQEILKRAGKNPQAGVEIWLLHI